MVEFDSKVKPSAQLHKDKLQLTCMSTMVHKLPELDIKNAVIWIDTVRNMIKTNCMEWVIVETDKKSKVNPEVSEKAEAAMNTTILDVILLEMMERLCKTLYSISV